MELYLKIASLVTARMNCIRTGNTEWRDKHEDSIVKLVKDYMPRGSGIDRGTQIDLDTSTGNRLVFIAPFHHMDDNGYYDGWTDHKIIVTPDLANGFGLKVTGRNRNMIKDYLAKTYAFALGKIVDAELPANA